MQEVQKRKRSARPRGRLWLLLVTVLLLSGAALLWQQANMPKTVVEEPEDTGYTAQTILHRDPSEVASISATLEPGDDWTLVQGEDGTLLLQDAEEHPLDTIYVQMLLNASARIEASALLTDDPAEYAEHLDEFGLDRPRAVICITYTDGQQITLRIGDQITYENDYWMYMLVDGLEGLYAMDKGTVDLYTIDGPLLLAIEQPVMHHQRFDCITMTLPGGSVLQWTLEGAISNMDAQDRWFLTQPLTYPADASALSSLRQHIASLRLGAYVGPATPENLALYGFDSPQMILTVHQAAGDMSSNDLSGEVIITPYPESTVELVVGGAKSQDIDYVRYGESIYISSHYALAALMNVAWRDTLSRFPVLTALGNLSQLTVTTAHGTDTYVITRTEQVQANNELLLDENDQPVYDLSCTLNGQPISYTAFEAAYNLLLTVSVSGTLPDGWTPSSEPHTTYTFADVNGTVHTIALAAYDPLHDAVLINGQALFYLIQGGFTLTVS